jgi:hypothetical protein
MGKVVKYDVKIEGGLPSAKKKTTYTKRLPDGRLEEIADQIKHGQFVTNLSAGSAGKLVSLLKHRIGLKALRRGGQEDATNTVYVESEEWLSKHPEVV